VVVVIDDMFRGGHAVNGISWQASSPFLYIYYHSFLLAGARRR